MNDGRHLGLSWLNAGSCHRPPQTNLENFCLALSRCFTGFILSYAQEQREKTPRRKAILGGKFQQLERQHNTQKGLLLPSFLPGGGTQQTFMREGAAPRLSSTPYLFNTIVDEKVTPFVYLLLTNGTPFTYMYTLFRTLHSF